LASLLIQAGIGTPPSLAKSEAEKAAERIEKIKAQAAKFGIGEKSRVEVHMKDKTKFRGYISANNGDSLTLVNWSNNSTKTFQFADMEKIHRHHYAQGLQLGLGIAAIAIVGLILIVVAATS
jgi:hypothetical protein